MTIKHAKIIAINDGLIPEIDPLFIELKERLPGNEILHFPNSNKGLDFVLNNLTEKIVVLLDINFSPGEKSGYEVFEDIRKKTSLVYVIMMTVRNLSEIPIDRLIAMINNDALALENSWKTQTIVNLVEDAIHKLDVRVDSVIEEWIMRHSEQMRNRPLIKTKDGKSYSMDEILQAIRLRQPIGIDFEKSLLQLAIDIFTRQQIKSE